MSSEAVGYVYRHSPYGDKTFNVHHAIADIVNDVHDNLFWLPLGRLAKKARCSRPTTTAAMEQLVKDGFAELVQASKGGGAPGEGSSVYRFLFPEKPVIFDSRSSAKPINTEPGAVLNSQRGSAKSTRGVGERASLLNPIEPKGNFQQKRTQAQIESDRRYGGEGARFPETTPEYIAEVERKADLSSSPPPVKPVNREAAKKAHELVQAFSERKGNG